MNVNHLGIFIEALAWANGQARLVFATFARLGDDHRHFGHSPDRIVKTGLGTGGGENLDEKADIESAKNSALPLRDLASRDLVALWRAGSQDAAGVLWARYEVRLVALIAARLNRRYRDGIAPEDVVQSAMGSFFRVTGADAKAPMSLESTASAWNILATFARRKLSRALERETAFKRGGGWDRAPLADVDRDPLILPSGLEAEEVLADLNSLLSADQSQLLELLLQSATQREIAERLGIDERTVRRRIATIRSITAGQLSEEASRETKREVGCEDIGLPNITYRQFVLGKMVGRGALGKVYRARLQAGGQVVAVKFMHRWLWVDPSSRLSFLREIDHASRIDHPGIVKYLGWGQSPHGGPYLVSEYIDGPSLADVERPSAATAVQWLIQVCHAIEAAHRAGVIHGDLTPNNVLLSRDDRIVITDFGFATDLDRRNSHSDQQRPWPSPGGTLGFAAPEQVSHAFGRISSATDIYAIGGLAYYFLTGHAPHGRNANSVLDTLSDDDVAPATPSSTPAESKLATLASAALKKAVTHRPKSANELAALLSAG
ncbi:MAG: protein kinase domain-containing protein [Aureliella sp.]